jgi:hypothetical protein
MSDFFSTVMPPKPNAWVSSTSVPLNRCASTRLLRLDIRHPPGIWVDVRKIAQARYQNTPICQGTYQDLTGTDVPSIDALKVGEESSGAALTSLYPFSGAGRMGAERSQIWSKPGKFTRPGHIA